MINYWILTRRNLCLFGLLPMVIGLVTCWLGWQWLAVSISFVENLQQSEARIQRFVPGADEVSMDVEYLDDDGVKYTQRFAVTDTEAVRLRAIGKVSLVFDRRDPRRSQLGHVVNANNEMLIDWAIFGAGVLFTLGGLTFILLRAQQIRAIGKLFTQGQIVQTEVRDIAMAPGKPFGRFTYAFPGPNGRWFEGKSPELSEAQLAEWPVGRALMAAFDPRDPRRTEADVFGVTSRRRRSVPQPA